MKIKRLKKLMAIAAVAACLSGCGGKWTTGDTIRQGAVLTTLTADWMQTRQISKNPDKWHETNPILGEHPSLGKVDAYFAACAIAHTAIAVALPSENIHPSIPVSPRELWQYVVIGVEIGAISNNLSLGIGIKF